MATCRYNYTELRFGGYMPSAVHLNGSPIYRLQLDGKDKIHKEWQTTYTATLAPRIQIAFRACCWDDPCENGTVLTVAIAGTRSGKPVEKMASLPYQTISSFSCVRGATPVGCSCLCQDWTDFYVGSWNGDVDNFHDFFSAYSNDYPDANGYSTVLFSQLATSGWNSSSCWYDKCSIRLYTNSSSYTCCSNVCVFTMRMYLDNFGDNRAALRFDRYTYVHGCFNGYVYCTCNGTTTNKNVYFGAGVSYEFCKDEDTIITTGLPELCYSYRNYFFLCTFQGPFSEYNGAGYFGCQEY